MTRSTVGMVVTSRPIRLPAGTDGYAADGRRSRDGSFLVQLVQADGSFEDVFAVTPLAQRQRDGDGSRQHGGALAPTP